MASSGASNKTADDLNRRHGRLMDLDRNRLCQENRDGEQDEQGASEIERGDDPQHGDDRDAAGNCRSATAKSFDSPLLALRNSAITITKRPFSGIPPPDTNASTHIGFPFRAERNLAADATFLTNEGWDQGDPDE